MEKYWIRLGDGDRYHSVDTIEEVAEEFKENLIISVIRHCLYGLESEEFQGNDYISLFTAIDPSGPLIREITDEDLEILNNLLRN